MDNIPFEKINISKSEPPAVILEAFINELKSPLASMKGWVKILTMHPDEKLIEQALTSMSTIIEKIEHEEERIIKYLADIKTG
jgi:light-regulated signal transduction histidine kinase (bacteriophytochrome)